MVSGQCVWVLLCIVVRAMRPSFLLCSVSLSYTRPFASVLWVSVAAIITQPLDDWSNYIFYYGSRSIPASVATILDELHSRLVVEVRVSAPLVDKPPPIRSRSSG